MTRHLQPVQRSPRTSTEARRLLEQRIRELDAFVPEHGCRYWDRPRELRALNKGRAA